MEIYTAPEDLRMGIVYEMWIGWGCGDVVKSRDTYIYSGLSGSYHRFESIRQCTTGAAVIHLVPAWEAKHYKFAVAAAVAPTETEVETGN
jgi:hypothetical protein